MQAQVAVLDSNQRQMEPQRKERKVFKERILALKALGWRDIEIARKLNICRRSVQRAMSEYRRDQQPNVMLPAENED